MTDDFETVREIFHQWTLYEKIIHFNFMKHQEVMQAIRQQVAEKFSEAVSVLDLGCGNGWLADESLKAASITAYTGIDLSEAALADAAIRWSKHTANVKVLAGNFADFLPLEDAEQCDIILASYSLHHFQESDKRRVVKLVAESLKPNGCFFWIDLVRQPRESRDEYLHRFFYELLPTWKPLSDEELAEIREHVSSSDFPETTATMMHMTEAADLKSAECLWTDDYFACWVFQAN